MSKREHQDQAHGTSTAEAVCRRIHGTALQLGGESGSRIANKVTGALGLGTIDLSKDA
ncbi:hypothetical protein ACP4TB_30200 [Streptomyces sp. DR3-1]|uniref:hypothetical protein n=1 Tax=Streptomyces sp. DR3-1 TaxID=2951169 RepID=UPI0020431E59|nr:hypothetical protein [Streptomyces sp. DR3-1]MCM3822545.1 hypothetical protein [Streptomyces sp. DR3-1]